MGKIKLTDGQVKEFLDDDYLDIAAGDYRIYLELDDREKIIAYFELIKRDNGKTKQIYAHNVDELELLIPKRTQDPSYYHNDPLCPHCGTYMIYHFEHCPRCGQKIDWSEN